MDLSGFVAAGLEGGPCKEVGATGLATAEVVATPAGLEGGCGLGELVDVSAGAGSAELMLLNSD